MLKINGCTAEYHHLYIYDDDSNILFQTERTYQLDLNIITDVRSARKLMFNKKDCFEIKNTEQKSYLFGNNKDLYIHNSIIDVIKIEEKLSFKSKGETNYKDIYTLRLNYLNGTEIQVESDFYTRTEKTDERLLQEKIANIISECLYNQTHVSHYEVEKMLQQLDIAIKV